MARSSSCICNRRTARLYSNRPAVWDGGVAVGSGVGDTVAVGTGVGDGSGVAVGTGVFVGTGVGDGSGVAVAIGGIEVGAGTEVGSAEGSAQAARSTARIGRTARKFPGFSSGSRNKFASLIVKSDG